MTLLTINGNPKIIKGDKLGVYKTAILHLAPANLSGYEVCKGRSKACTKACLNTAGRGKMNSVQEARIRRTKLFFEQPKVFKDQLYLELNSFIKHCQKKDLIPCVRLNGTSDLDWTVLFPEIFDLDIQYYDYTKIYSRMVSYLNNKLPTNYHLTFSRSENNQKKVQEIVKLGGNVAVVFKNFPKKYLDKKVFNGDNTDLRFTDPQNVIVGLTPKGKAKKDVSGFVVS